MENTTSKIQYHKFKSHKGNKIKYSSTNTAQP